MPKRCPKCRTEKRISEFYTPKTPYCKPCSRLYMSHERPGRKPKPEVIIETPRSGRYDDKLSAKWLRMNLGVR